MYSHHGQRQDLKPCIIGSMRPWKLNSAPRSAVHAQKNCYIDTPRSKIQNRNSKILKPKTQNPAPGPSQEELLYSGPKSRQKNWILDWIFFGFGILGGSRSEARIALGPPWRSVWVSFFLGGKLQLDQLQSGKLQLETTFVFLALAGGASALKYKVWFLIKPTYPFAYCHIVAH